MQTNKVFLTPSTCHQPVYFPRSRSFDQSIKSSRDNLTNVEMTLCGECTPWKFFSYIFGETFMIGEPAKNCRVDARSVWNCERAQLMRDGGSPWPLLPLKLKRILTFSASQPLEDRLNNFRRAVPQMCTQRVEIVHCAGMNLKFIV